MTRRTTPLIALVAALLLASCGGGQEPVAAPAPPPAAAAPQAAPIPTASQLMDWAEATYPQLFPGHQTNQVSAPYVFRHYPSTGNYVGLDANNIYILGPVAGSNSVPVLVGTLDDFGCRVFPSACAPAGPSSARGAQLWAQSLGSQGFACKDCHFTPTSNFSQIWNASGTASSQGNPQVIVNAIAGNSGGSMFQFDMVSAADLADIAAYINASRYGKALQ